MDGRNGHTHVSAHMPHAMPPCLPCHAIFMPVTHKHTHSRRGGGMQMEAVEKERKGEAWMRRLRLRMRCWYIHITSSQMWQAGSQQKCKVRRATEMH